ncbi:restriction endonuclease [Streptomyces buecherae]|uniref:Restriction endonuclease n=1 Tax=Streptomyces buecherae TaxID=2763006 RepID=A0A7H8NBG1_9ACTN|nr:restriction endonuclease [Streptomyces buecherae]QKW51696.1 restriction endonuclease [Streptomyces buecherae]
MVEWSVKEGERLKRVALHEVYGGRRQGGIGPSRVSPNILLFTDPSKGRQHGYFDGWGEDGCYHYAGEGQNGDQRMTQGNLSILNHRQHQRALRLFQAVGAGAVEYIGEFELAADEPWYRTDAPDTDGELRSVIMFRLRPVDVAPHKGARLPHTPEPSLSISEVDVEQQHTERALVDPSREPYEAERREASLVREYVEYLRREGHQVVRHKILPGGVLKALYTDIYDVTEGVLIEAKGTVHREAIRLAIGQLFDYRRHISPSPRRLALLVPSRPEDDLLDLCASVEITVIWPEGEGYARTSGR